MFCQMDVHSWDCLCRKKNPYDSVILLIFLSWNCVCFNVCCIYLSAQMRRHVFNIRNYWGLKLIEQVIKVLEHAAECLIRQRVVLSSFAIWSYRWGRESWLLYFNWVVAVMWLLVICVVFLAVQSVGLTQVVCDCGISWSYSLAFLHRFRSTKIFSVKMKNIFLPISFNICFGWSKEPSHWDGSFEYPQHMFWLRNKEIKFSLHTLN